MSLKRKSEEVRLVIPDESMSKHSRLSSASDEADISMWQPPPSALPKPASTTPLPEIIVSESLSEISTEADGIIKPHENDVVCRRGGRAIKNPGNALYRKLIDSKKKLYHSCGQEYKTVVAMSIVDTIYGQKPAGRFLQLDPKTGLWFEIVKMKAIQKTSMALAQARREQRKKNDNLQDKNEVTDTESNGDASDGDDQFGAVGAQNKWRPATSTLEEVSELTNEDSLVPLPYYSLTSKLNPYDKDFVSFMNTQQVLFALFDDKNNVSS